MFGSIGGPELLFIFVLALLIFGPRKLPEIGRTIGRTLAEFRKSTNEFTATLDREMEAEKLKDLRSELTDTARETAALARPPLRSDAAEKADAAVPAAGAPEPDAEPDSPKAGHPPDAERTRES